MMRGRTGAITQDFSLAQLYLDVAEVIIIALDNQGTVTEINRKGSEILGFPRNEIIGKNWFIHFIPERIRNTLFTNFEKMLKGAIYLKHYENPILTRSGREKLIRWHNIPIHDSTGKIIGTLSSGEDVTEERKLQKELFEYQKRLEQGIAERTSTLSKANTELRLTRVELDQAEKGLRLRAAVLEKAPEPIFLTDLAGNLVFVNNIAINMFGFKRQKLIGMSFWELVQPHARPLVESMFKDLTKKQDIEYTTDYIQENGTRLSLKVHSAIIEIPEGKYILSLVHSGKGEDRG